MSTGGERRNRVTLRGAKTTARVAFEHGRCLTQLADHSSTELPPGGPWLQIGSDARGKEIARVDLNHFQAQAEPHSFG